MSTGICKIPAFKGHLPKLLSPILLHKALVVRALLYTLMQLDFRALTFHSVRMWTLYTLNQVDVGSLQQ